MLIKIADGKLHHDLVITPISGNEVMLTWEDKKRKVYLHASFSGTKALMAVLWKYVEKYPWEVTTEVAKEVIAEFDDNVENFVRFIFNLK